MIYIKAQGSNVTLAGEVANQSMLDSGYVQYTGVIPELLDNQIMKFDGTDLYAEDKLMQTKTTMSSLTFFNRFTEAEQIAIATATLSNVPLKIFYDKMMAADFVDVTNGDTIGGVDALISAGLVDASRKDLLLAPEEIVL